MRGEESAVAAEQGFAPPRDFDGFRVIRPLGRGGMGHVYLGHDDMLDRAVALKFLTAADPKFAARDRFLVEARAIARLQHPNVVGIFRVGEVLGHPYIAYELVTGQSLDQLPKPVSWQRALDLAVGVARGLAAAHRRDVLHRDIKPANVMLADSGDIKILDFGLAKLLDGPSPAITLLPPPIQSDTHPRAVVRDAPEAVERPRLAPDAALVATIESAFDSYVPSPRERSFEMGTPLTATGAMLGTPLYMAPELWRGEAATAPSDVYALGLLVYELLTGRLPYEGLGAAELAHAVLTHEPPPIRSVCAGLPQAFGDVVDRCVRARREDRYANAEEVRDALEAIRSLYRPFVGEARSPLADHDDAMEITASFGRLAPAADSFSGRVYQRLFEMHPELRPLFPSEMVAVRRKLFGALVTVVDNLRRPERIVPLLEDLGRRHVAYGVKAEHFDMVGDALIGSIAEFDDHFHEATRSAWTAAYARVAQAMQRGLEEARSTPRPATNVTVREFEPPRTRYARSGEVNLAYQVLGSGSLDIVLVVGWLTHLEVGWQWTARARFLRRLASLGRLVLFDARGTGLSDPVGQSPLLEERTADLRAVMDAAGVERAALVGLGLGAATSALFAATHPDRTRALVLYGASANAADAEHDAHVRALIRASWGEPLFLDTMAPSLEHDEPFRRWWARFLRMSASPGAAIAHHTAGAAIDVRGVLPAIRVPALVVHRIGDKVVPIEESRYLAANIPGARHVALEGSDHLPFVGDVDRLMDEIRDFFGGPALEGMPVDESWIAAAVVSLAPRAELVPASGRGGTDPLRLVCDREVARFRGIELDGPGEGRAAAMFDGPMRAVRFAHAVLARARSLGAELAAGIHFGVCRVGDVDADGEAVRIAPMVAARAGAGEVLVTAPVQALLVGAGLSVERRGAIERGIEVFAITAEP